MASDDDLAVPRCSTAMLRVLAAALAAALFVAPASRAQTVAVSDSAAADGSGARCVRLGETTVCHTHTDAGSTVTVRERTQERASYEAGPSEGFDLRAFAVGDLLVVATLDNVSNGLGVTYWTLGVIPQGARAPAYSFTVEDFSPTGDSFGTWRGRAVLWATEWTTMPDPAGRRPPGMYVVGRPFTLGDDGLVPVRGLPIRARRFLRTFSRETGTPVEWLSERRAETLRTDPALVGLAPTTTRGTVTAASWDVSRPSWEALAVTLRTDDGLLTVRSAAGAPGDEAAPTFTHLGDAPTGRLWPADYRPADVSAWLAGRPARLEVRGDGLLWRE